MFGPLTSTDFFLFPIYLLLLVLIGFAVKLRLNKFEPTTKYFFKGFLCKIIAGSTFCIIYSHFYEGGDSNAYFRGALAISNLLYHDLSDGLGMIFNGTDYSVFNSETGYPPYYMFRHPKTFAVCRLVSVVVPLGAYSFLATTMLVSALSFIGIWKFYRLLCTLYPNNEKWFFYLILAFPSLLFWGSGIMKDTIVLSSTCWVTYNFYKIFITRQKIIANVIMLLVNVVLIATIKPYVLLSLFPGMLIWFYHSSLINIRHQLLRFLAMPIIGLFVVFIGAYIYASFGEKLGVYSDYDTAIKQAQIIQKDLLRTEQYGSNNYFLGEIDGTILGMLSLAPAAMFTAIFRPLFWEIGSPPMAISAVENTFMLLFSIYLIIKIPPLKLVQMIFNDPYLMFALVFSLFFAFGIGIASTNFGALVRYRIPLLPFFFSALYIIYSSRRSYRK